jgi:hypothetical protein
MSYRFRRLPKGVFLMTSLSLAKCCRLLTIDYKTLRRWLAQAQIAWHTDPTNAKIKCLEVEQVETLARLHGRVLKPEASASAVSPRPSGAQSQGLSTALPDTDLRARLAQMEEQMATLQAQLTDLTLQLLREREQRAEQRLLALETQLISTGDHALALPFGSTPRGPDRPEMPPFACHPTEKRALLIPLIEYGARGRYVLISPEEGELPITPDSPEWFAWLAALSSFRFVGQSGRFSARRGYNRRPNRSWYAQRGIHQKNYSKYIGVSEHITTERLEQIAAYFQSYMK